MTELSDDPFCLGQMMYTADGLSIEVRKELAMQCDGCPVYRTCEKGIEGDRWFIIRAGRYRHPKTKVVHKV